ncbi:MAG: SDR family NAD(P)-dependent oxidoreductase, partial [Dehalococcoidia bacterium]
MQDLAGKVAVVTGGGSGIGRALCLAFAAEGMDVAVADVESGPAEEVAAAVRAAGRKAIAVQCDVSNLASVQALAEAANRELGGCHVLCNNAGVLVMKLLDQCTEADWRWLVDVNLMGVANGLLAFLPRLREQGHGHIVNTASVAGLFPQPAQSGLSIYTATKFAVVGLSEELRAELSGTGVGVSVLCPGGVATRILDAGRNRPASLGGPQPVPSIERLQGLTAATPPEEIAAKVVRAI